MSEAEYWHGELIRATAALGEVLSMALLMKEKARAKPGAYCGGSVVEDAEKIEGIARECILSGLERDVHDYADE